MKLFTMGNARYRDIKKEYCSTGVSCSGIWGSDNTARDKKDMEGNIFRTLGHRRLCGKGHLIGRVRWLRDSDI